MDRVPEIKLLLDVAHLKVSSNILKFDLIKANEQIEKFVAAYHLRIMMGLMIQMT